MDQVSQQVQGVAVQPPRPGLVDQRRRCHRLHVFAKRRVLVSPDDREVQPNTRRMSERVPNGDFAQCRPRALPRHLHPHLLKLGQVHRHGIVDRESAFFEQHQRRHSRHRFGHRGDVEQRILRHRVVDAEAACPARLVVDNLAATGHQRHKARGLLPLDHVVDPFADARQALRRHAGRFGTRERERIGCREAERDSEEQSKKAKHGAPMVSAGDPARQTADGWAPKTRRYQMRTRSSGGR